MSTMGCITHLRLMPYVVLLVVVSSSAIAQEVWKEVASDGEEIGFAAPGTISPYANTKEMWELRDLKATAKKAPNGNEYRSRLRHASYRCEEKRLLVTEEMFFEGNGGNGRLVGRVGIAIGQTDDWVAVQPKSVEETMMKIACTERSRGFVLDTYRAIDKKIDKFFRPIPQTTRFIATL